MLSLQHNSGFTTANQAQSEYKHSLTFRVRTINQSINLCCHSNETRALIANLLKEHNQWAPSTNSTRNVMTCFQVVLHDNTCDYSDHSL